MKTHWKKLRNPIYLGAYDFDKNEQRNVIIDKVVLEQVKGADGKSEECTVVYLKGSKPFICNATNAKAITKVSGTPYIEDWQGVEITLFTQTIRAFGDTVDALRVKSQTIQQKKEKLSDDRFKKALEAVKSGQYDPEKLKLDYELTPEQIKQL